MSAKRSKIQAITCLLLAQLMINSTVLAKSSGGGVIDGGGADSTKNTIESIKLIIQSDSLKNSLINYLKTLKITEVQNSEVQTTLKNMLDNGQLLNDIKNSPYFIYDSCSDSQGNSVAMSTTIGLLGSEICVAPTTIQKENSTLNQEDLLIELASLAIHEHIHHFQDKNNSLQFNENNAYKVSAYLKQTAKYSTLPVLKWVNLVNKIKPFVLGGIVTHGASRIFLKCIETNKDNCSKSQVVYQEISAPIAGDIVGEFNIADKNIFLIQLEENLKTVHSFPFLKKITGERILNFLMNSQMHNQLMEISRNHFIELYRTIMIDDIKIDKSEATYPQ